MTDWGVFIVGGLVTYCLRVSFIALGSRLTIPRPVERALHFVAPAVFAAIFLPNVLGGAGFGELLAPGPQVWAAGIAGLIVWKTRNVPLTIGGGMIALWLLGSFYGSA